MYFAPHVRSRAFASPRAFDRSFERFVTDAYDGARRSLKVEQDDKSWTLRLDVPGVAREDLDIGIEGAVVRIETRAETPRAFKAAYSLPQDIDTTASDAKLENGVLTLRLAKLEPVSKAVSLAIN